MSHRTDILTVAPLVGVDVPFILKATEREGRDPFPVIASSTTQRLNRPTVKDLFTQLKAQTQSENPTVRRNAFRIRQAVARLAARRTRFTRSFTKQGGSRSVVREEREVAAPDGKGPHKGVHRTFSYEKVEALEDVDGRTPRFKRTSVYVWVGQRPTKAEKKAAKRARTTHLKHDPQRVTLTIDGVEIQGVSEGIFEATAKAEKKAAKRANWASPHPSLED